MRGVVCADNHSPTNADAHGLLVSEAPNLVRDPGTARGLRAHDLTRLDPMLGPLQDNGGATPTHGLSAGSPAVDAGDPTLFPSTDQRGEARPGGARADLGSFELFLTPNVKLVGNRTPSEGWIQISLSASSSGAEFATEFSVDLRAWFVVGSLSGREEVLYEMDGVAGFYRVRLKPSTAAGRGSQWGQVTIIDK
jgi:hypothetical protein